MELLLIIVGVLIGLATIAKIIFWFAELIENTKLESQFGAEVATLNSRLEAVRVPDMRKELNALQAQSLGRLVGSDGKVLNVCPRCGGTMRILGGIYLSCINPRCSWEESVEVNDDTVETLTVR
jgi:hypothetical protein